MRAEVESLLRHDKPAAEFIEESAFEVTARLLAEDETEANAERRIGSYKILREIGRGGMGVVYLAERDDEYRKQVAIKLIKRGMDTDAVLQRFRHERQILANLEHPNIARLLDGGTTDDGLPYFVMEYIEGLPVDTYCDKHKLTTDERLKLFRTVCAAVTYAHQNLVIHRDLKPINILVTDEGVPKLLDFGIAKLLHPSMEQATTATVAGLRVLTPEYASPEQIRGEKLTTATDVYSLGVILYELLTGQRPFQLKDTTPQELLRAIEEGEPTKPSKVTGNGHEHTASYVARNQRLLKGDLDNIVLKALRKEPERRYKSVEQFSEDIRRYLEGLPVIARKDTFVYRTSKFMARNRAAVAAAVLILLTLIGGIVATTWQARRAREQARIAEAKSAEAQAALAKTEKINRFMQTIFSYANPDWFGRAGGRRDMTVLEAMRDIENHIEEDFRNEPDLRADVYQQIGDAYRTQHLFDDAERNLRKALALRLQLYGEDSAKTAESMYILSGVRFQQGDLSEQERLLYGALSIQRRHANEGNNLPYMMLDYAALLGARKNDYAGALTFALEALEIFRRRYGDNHYMVSQTQAQLIGLYNQIGDYAQAERVAQEHIRQQQQPDATALFDYAATQIFKGDYQAAENMLRQLAAQAQSANAKPEMMPRIYYAQSFMAYRRGDYAQASAYAEKASGAQSNIDDFSYSRARHLSPALNKLGQTKRAEAILRQEIESLERSERVLDLATLKSVLGESLTMQHRFAEAETVLLEAYNEQKTRVLPTQYDLLQTRQRLSELYRAWGREDEAQKYQ